MATSADEVVDNVVSEEEEEEEEGETDEILNGLVEKLQELDSTRESYLEEYLKERAALEAKYQAKYSGLYKERAQIIQGQESCIPHFWVSALSNMETVGSMIAEQDVDCLDCLLDITCKDDADGTGFTLQFFFAKNEYFDNEILTKRYQVPNLMISGDEPILKKVIGCDIQWKEGKCLTEQVVTKKQKGKGKHSGQLRTVTRTEKKDSFFHWFNPPTMPPLEEMNEEVALQLEAAFEQDYDAAQALRTQIIPKAVRWFTGETGQPDLEDAVDDLVAAEPE
ncbi:Nucleosome assembly protein 1;3 [Seminavis robusta]|uniref:Nucleosome assembly protein 13 n=1 Tax=Seminavis robusta TaxID=568900 RepID=A0A9N8D521_9STRA|nr:Nucleosome assembly protein 1;3 [Seminavis robusta]|eukprot:Sro2_g001850.1 Nucleosome assembly protein 1;3 (280) ;mRNA; r:260404-261243